MRGGVWTIASCIYMLFLIPAQPGPVLVCPAVLQMSGMELHTQRHQMPAMPAYTLLCPPCLTPSYAHY